MTSRYSSSFVNRQEARDPSDGSSHSSSTDENNCSTRESGIEKVLTAVRINLYNASKTWGERSPQYEAVRLIEGQLLIEKAEAWGLDDGELSDLLGGLDISRS